MAREARNVPLATCRGKSLALSKSGVELLQGMCSCKCSQGNQGSEGSEGSQGSQGSEGSEGSQGSQGCSLDTQLPGRALRRQ